MLAGLKTLAPLLGGLLFLQSCSKEVKKPEELVRTLYASVIYGKDEKVCVELFSEYVYLTTFMQQKIKPTKEQAKEICKGYTETAKQKSLFPIYGIKEFQVTLADVGKDQKLASVFIIMQDGRSEPAGNIKLFKKEDRWYMEY